MSQEFKRALKEIVAICNTAINTIGIAERAAREPNIVYPGMKVHIDDLDYSVGIVATYSLHGHYQGTNTLVVWVNQDESRPGTQTRRLPYAKVRRMNNNQIITGVGNANPDHADS